MLIFNIILSVNSIKANLAGFAPYIELEMIVEEDDETDILLRIRRLRPFINGIRVSTIPDKGDITI